MRKEGPPFPLPPRIDLMPAMVDARLFKSRRAGRDAFVGIPGLIEERLSIGGAKEARQVPNREGDAHENLKIREGFFDGVWAL